MPSENDEFDLQMLVAGEHQCSTEVVVTFSDRLLRLASSRMPERMQARVDPADVVQSAFRSFFTKHRRDGLDFAETEDVWRLLAAITFHKVQHAIRYHSRKVRDVRRDVIGHEQIQATESGSPTASSLSIMEDTLRAILRELPATHQQVLQLRLEGHSIDEIATKLDVSTRTVNRGLKLARTVAGRLVNQEPPGERTPSHE
ncbi:MAG: sigma-70 family RNA polymerase sigma factor [Planctomycetota bacterium]